MSSNLMDEFDAWENRGVEKPRRRGNCTAPIPVDKEAVRVLVLAVGPSEAARELGLKEDTVKKWCSRGKWLSPVPVAVTAPLPASMVSSVPPVPTAAIGDALARFMHKKSKQTRVMLASAAHKLAQKSVSAGLDQSGDVLNVMKLSAGVHGWDSQQPAQQHPFNGLSGLQINVQVNSQDPQP